MAVTKRVDAPKQITDADKEQLARWKQENYVEYLDEDFNDSLSDAMISVERVRSIVTALQQYANQINQEKACGSRSSSINFYLNA